MRDAARAPDALRVRTERALVRAAPWITGGLIAALASRGVARRVTFDFSCYRDAAVALSEGAELYPAGQGVYLYAPVFAALFRPLAWLSPEVGSVLWTAASAGALGAALWLTSETLRVRGSEVAPWVPPAILLLVATAAASDFGHGNANAFLVLLITFAGWTWSLPVRRTFAGGLALALAISMKLTPGILLPWLLIRRDLRALGATCAGLVIWLVLLPAVLMGPATAAEHTGHWLHRVLLPTVAADAAKGPEILSDSGSSLPAVVTMLLSSAPRDEDEVHPRWPLLSAETARRVGRGIAVVLLGATFAATAARSAWVLELGLLMAASLLVAPVSRSGHFVELIPLVAVLLVRAGSPGPEARVARVGLLAALALFGGALAAGEALVGSSKAFFPLAGYTFALWATGLRVLWRFGRLGSANPSGGGVRLGA